MVCARGVAGRGGDSAQLDGHRRTTRDCDIELIQLVREAVTIPVIASGGAGTADHFAEALDAGADAVLAASVFHFGILTIAEVKAAIAAAGHLVR